MPAEPSSDDSRSDQGSMSPLQVLSHQNVILRVYQRPRTWLRLMKWNIGCWSFWSRRRRLTQHLLNQGSQMRFSFSNILKKRTAKLKMKKNNRRRRRWQLSFSKVFTSESENSTATCRTVRNARLLTISSRRSKRWQKSTKHTCKWVSGGW